MDTDVERERGRSDKRRGRRETAEVRRDLLTTDFTDEHGWEKWNRELRELREKGPDRKRLLTTDATDLHGSERLRTLFF